MHLVSLLFLIKQKELGTLWASLMTFLQKEKKCIPFFFTKKKEKKKENYACEKKLTFKANLMPASPSFC